MQQDEKRLLVLERIREYEKCGKFDLDVEDDPQTIPLTTDKVDYLNEKPFAKLSCWVGNVAAKTFFDNEIKKKRLIIEKVEGLENFDALGGKGAVITCNHFNAYDNYAVYKVLEKRLNKQRQRLYKVIREGNYTSFGGLYGFFFRHCNTLPLARDPAVMKKFLHAVSILLGQNKKILIYPEQAMWWNYKKPRPLKEGAFHLAAKNNAPVLPCFITMRDSEQMGDDGFYVQAYTLHFSPAIFNDGTLSVKENEKRMSEINFADWKEIYERVYEKPLTYAED